MNEKLFQYFMAHNTHIAFGSGMKKKYKKTAISA
jgi:hypothetical protein